MNLDEVDKLKAEPHSEIWRGNQWVVTTEGLRPHVPQYADYLIEAFSLGEPRLGHCRGRTLSNCLLHMAEKNWVDINDFIAAWCVAVAVHCAPIGNMDVASSVRKAVKRKAAAEEYNRTHPPGKWYYHGQSKVGGTV